jgi:hypothetical protein
MRAIKKPRLDDEQEDEGYSPEGFSRCEFQVSPQPGGEVFSLFITTYAGGETKKEGVLLTSSCLW